MLVSRRTADEEPSHHARMLSQKREVTAHDTVATSSAKNSSQHLSPQLRIAIQGPKMKSAAPQEAGDPKDKPCLLCTMEQKSRFWKAVKSLALLRLFRSTNRRVQRLHTVAVRCWRSLTAQGLPGATSLLPRECHHLPEPEEDVGSPETSSTSSTADTPMEPETSTESAATEAKQDSLETLPQRFHMPAPKVLCRPSAQRWVKPCCTRSCGESLERTLTIRYPR